jgi:hypothetical protein
MSLICCHAAHPNIPNPVDYLTHSPKLVARAVCVPYPALLSRPASRLPRLASQNRTGCETPLQLMQNHSGHVCIETQNERRRAKPSMLAHRKRPARSCRTKQWVSVRDEVLRCLFRLCPIFQQYLHQRFVRHEESVERPLAPSPLTPHLSTLTPHPSALNSQPTILNPVLDF